MKPTQKPKKTKGWSLASYDMFGTEVAFNIDGDDNFKTVVGCLWTVLMFCAVIGAFVFYIVQFMDKGNVEVTTNISIQSEYPKLDFFERGFFFSLYATRDKQIIPITDLNNIISFVAYQVSITSDEADRNAAEEAPPVGIPFGPCKTAGVEASIGDQAIIGKSVSLISDMAYCSVNTGSNSMYAVGNEDSDEFAYIRIKILPCATTDPNCLYHFIQVAGVSGAVQCARLNLPQVSSIYTPILAPPDLGSLATPGCDCTPPSPQAGACEQARNIVRTMINDQIAKVIFTFNFIEGAVKPEQYENPFSYSFKSNLKVYGTIETTKVLNIFFREVEVNTDKGSVWEVQDTQTTLGFDSVIADFLDRGEGKEKKEKKPDGSVGAIPQSFMEFNIYSSNNKLTFNRSYLKILDVFSSVGGVTRAIGFLITFCYAWYNSIRMEQRIINKAVLRTDKVKTKKKFSFMNLIRFGFREKGFCFCCKKKKSRYAEYQECKDVVETQTDITGLMELVANVDSIKDALLTQYQLRLFSYLTEKKKIEEKGLSQDIRSLKDKIQPKSDVKKRFDNEIWQNLPNEVKNDVNLQLGIDDETENLKDRSKFSPQFGSGFGEKSDQSNFQLNAKKTVNKFDLKGGSKRRVTHKKSNSRVRKNLD